MPGMGLDWASIGTQAAGGIIGAGMGLLLEGHNDRRQLKQQQALLDQQYKMDNQMANQNWARQYQFWEATNYDAQVQQLKKAGLNPALLYSKGGPGGITGQQGAHVQSGHAPAGGMEVMNMMMQNAQIQLLKAQTEKTKAETGNVPLTGQNIQASTASLTQGIQNQKAQQQLTEVQSSIASIAEHIAGKTQNAQVALIMNELQHATRVLKTLQNEGAISDATVKDKISMVKQQLALAYLDGWLKSAQTENVKQDTAASIEKIKMLWEENMRQWDKLSLETKDQTMRQLNSIEDMPSEIKDMLQALGLGFIFGKVGQTPTTPIRGFHQRN